MVGGFLDELRECGLQCLPDTLVLRQLQQLGSQGDHVLLFPQTRVEQPADQGRFIVGPRVLLLITSKPEYLRHEVVNVCEVYAGFLIFPIREVSSSHLQQDSLGGLQLVRGVRVPQ